MPPKAEKTDPGVEATAAGCVVDDEPQHAAKRKKGKKKRVPPKRNTDAVGAYSVPDFCRLHGGMSEAFFHKIVSEGHGPRLMKIGARTMVSVEAAQAWRCEREAEAQREAEDKQQEAAAKKQQQQQKANA